MSKTRHGSRPDFRDAHPSVRDDRHTPQDDDAMNYFSRKRNKGRGSHLDLPWLLHGDDRYDPDDDIQMA